MRSAKSKARRKIAEPDGRPGWYGDTNSHRDTAVEAKRVRAAGAGGRCSTVGEMFGAALRSCQKPETGNDDT
jgi:hypothetical protein